METHELNIKVGDRVVITRPRTAGSFAATVDRCSTVTAVRAKSFDAGGLCFRYDGREWGGHNRVRFIGPGDAETGSDSVPAIDDASAQQRGERAREDAVLAFLLSSRHEKEWLKLGIHELRRIAALHGIQSPQRDPQESTPARTAAHAPAHATD